MATNFSDVSKNFRELNSDVKVDYDVQAIENSIANILTISKGEIPGRPRFGSNLADFLFEEMDDLTFDTMDEVIRNAILEFEPRVSIVNVDFTPYHSESILSLEITYRILSSGIEHVQNMNFNIGG